MQKPSAGIARTLSFLDRYLTIWIFEVIEVMREAGIDLSAVQPVELTGRMLTDCFLAARAVGPIGRVIGVDMTPEMISRARENARKVSASNVEFRLGEIEHLPVADQTVDAIMTLDEVIRYYKGRVPPYRVMHYMCHVARGLDFAHALGIVHRDHHLAHGHRRAAMGPARHEQALGLSTLYEAQRTRRRTHRPPVSG